MKAIKTSGERLVRTSVRTTRENEVLKSDRMELVDAANRLIGQMITKQIVPVLRSEFATEPFELSTMENEAYRSALEFLSRQFDQGYAMAETLERRVESDTSTDFANPTARPLLRRGK